MFVGVVALHYQHHTTECHNTHQNSQSPLTNFISLILLQTFLRLNLCYSDLKELSTYVLD